MWFERDAASCSAFGAVAVRDDVSRRRICSVVGNWPRVLWLTSRSDDAGRDARVDARRVATSAAGRRWSAALLPDDAWEALITIAQPVRGARARDVAHAPAARRACG